MALRWFDSFDHYTPLSVKYTQGSLTAAPASGQGHFGSYAHRSVNSGVIRTFDNQATWIIGGAYKWDNSPTSSGSILGVTDSGTWQVDVAIDASNQWYLRRNSSAASIIATATGTRVLTNVWYFIELKVTIHNTAGAYELRVNGETVLSGTGANTRQTANNYANQVQWYSVGAGASVDDIYACDSTGSVYNDFLGEHKIIASFPTGNGALQDFTASAGSAYAAIDEVQHNSDTDYISSATAGHRSTFTFPALGQTGAVRGLTFNAVVRKDDVAARTVRPVLRIGGVNYFGTTVTVSTSYALVNELFPLNPATGSAWTVTEIDATELGLELVS